MSLRNLFSNGVVSSIPAVSSAEPGQALTVDENGKLAWITPGAGPTGPIQGVEGTPNQIIASEPSESGIVTLSLPDSILIDTIAIGHDPTVVNSGYTLPISTVDVDGDALANGSNYSMQFVAATDTDPGAMRWVQASATSGVTSVTGGNGITAIPTTGAVSLGLGNITPTGITTAGNIGASTIAANSINATTLTVGTGANNYRFPLTADGLTTGNYVMALTAAVPGTSAATFTFTEEAAGGGINTVTSVTTGIGSGINVDVTTNPAEPKLSLGDIIPSSVIVNNAYSLPTTSGLQNYVLTLGAPNPGNPTPVTWLPQGTTTAGVNTVVGANGVTPATAESGNVTIGLNNITPSSVNTPVVVATTSLTVGSAANAYTLPESNASLADTEKYVLQYNQTEQKFAFTQETAGGAGVQTVTSEDDGTVGSGIVVINTDAANPVLELGNIVPVSVSVKGAYTLPDVAGTANYAMVMPATGTELTWAPITGTGGSGTVESITAGANIEVTGANPTVTPTVALNPVLTGITSIGTGSVTATGQIQAATFNATNTITVTNSVEAATFNAPQPNTENESMINLGNNFIVKAGTTSAAGTSLLFQDRDTNKGFRIGSAFNGMQIITGEEAGTPAVTQGYILPTSLPTATGQVLAVSSVQAGATLAATEWVAQSGGGAVASVTSTNQSFIQSPGTTGAVELSLPAAFDISIPDAIKAATQSFKLGNVLITQTKTNTPANTTIFSCIDNTTDKGLTVNGQGVSIEVDALENYVLPLTLPTTGQFLYCESSDGTTANCSWVNGTSSGINQVDGTINQIVTTTPSAGVVKLELAPQVAITDLSTGRPSLTVGSCVIGAETSGSPAVTVTSLTITDTPTGNGFIVNNLGTKIQVGDGNTPPTTTSTYFLPKNSPAVGDIMTCTAAADGETPAICAWSSSPAGDQVNADVTMTGIVLQTPPNTPKATSITPTTAGTNLFNVKIFQAGATKYLYMTFDTLYNAGGCQCIFEENTYVVGEIDCGNIDITDAPGVQSEILTDGADMNIGLISYSTTTKTGTEPNIITTPAGSYGYASVVLKRVDINTLTLRLVLLPRGTTSNTIDDSSYGIADGQWLTFGAVQSFTAFGNQTPSAKCLFSYY